MNREWDRLSDDERKLIETYQSDGPVRVSRIAKELGVPIVSATLPAGISGEIRPADGGYVIRINRHDAETRQRFTAAHEIAHYLLHRDQIGQGIHDDVLYRSKLSDAREAEANRLASLILMPKNLVREALSDAKLLDVSDVASYVADRLNVSEAAAKIRLGLS